MLFQFEFFWATSRRIILVCFWGSSVGRVGCELIVASSNPVFNCPMCPLCISVSEWVNKIVERLGVPGMCVKTLFKCGPLTIFDNFYPLREAVHDSYLLLQLHLSLTAASWHRVNQCNPLNFSLMFAGFPPLLSKVALNVLTPRGKQTSILSLLLQTLPILTILPLQYASDISDSSDSVFL